MNLHRYVHRSATTMAPQENTDVNQENSFTSRLELRTLRTARTRLFGLFSSSPLCGGEVHPRVDRCAVEERRAKRGKDAGSVNSSAIRATEDAGPRSSVASALLRARKRAALGCVAVAMGLLLTAAPQAQAAAPKWKLTVTPSATYFLPAPDENAVYTIEAEDVGASTSASEQFAIEDTLPAGLSPYGPGEEGVVDFYSTPTGFGHGNAGVNPAENLAGYGLCPTALRCEYPGPLTGHLPAIKRGEKLVMQVRVAVPAEGFPLGALEDSAKISGGAAPTAEASTTNEVSAAPPYRISGFSASLTESDCELTEESCRSFTQAGGHPFQYSTEFNFADATEAYRRNLGEGFTDPAIHPDHDPQSIVSELPPGLIANPQAVPHCELAAFFIDECPRSTIVGTVAINHEVSEARYFYVMAPLINLQPAGNYPGLLGYDFNGIDFLITTGLRTATDYGVTATSSGLLAIGLNRVRVTLWGIPAEHSHDNLRGKECPYGTYEIVGFERSPAVEFHKCELQQDGLGLFGYPEGGPAEVSPTPFVTMPTQCTGEPLEGRGRSSAWQLPGQEATASADIPPIDGCENLRFEPQIEARPTTDLADSPSGFNFTLKVPQHEEVNELATPDLKEAVVKLPQGLTVNPSSANGLGACSPAQIGLTTPVGTTPAHFTAAPAECPRDSALGEVEVHTSLLHNKLEGSIYLATPHQNPSGSLLAGYIVIEGEGIIVKLAGQFHTDPATGQVTASFLENPQTPFGEFYFHFFGGADGALRTPAVCGSYETTSELTPYSTPYTPDATPTAQFETEFGQAGEGSFCPHNSAEEEDKPVFHAGTETPRAGAYSPFSFRLAREDGSQEIKQIETTLPPGLVGRLAGVEECPAADIQAARTETGAEERANPSCPLGSELGTVEVASGAGPTPYYVQGHAYLTGPYKGAPISLAIITPAVAGPFDLGDVVVMTALYVNPETAQITAKSDEIPTILEGIPLDVRQITVKMSRPGFTLNPTSCDMFAFTGSALSVLGASAPLSQHFQVGGCPALPFAPHLALSLTGGTKRAQNPALTATLTTSPGEANVAGAQVTLPPSEFVDNAHIQDPCTRVQFAEGSTPGEKCPPGSVLGFAKAETLLLEKPLEGPVYLRSNGGARKLPDMVAALNGEIDVALDGHIDTGKGGGVRNTFEVVPDAPVSKFTLQLNGGKTGLLQNSKNLCQTTDKAIVDLTGQNGKLHNSEPLIKTSCKKKKGKKHAKKRHRAQRRHL